MSVMLSFNRSNEHMAERHINKTDWVITFLKRRLYANASLGISHATMLAFRVLSRVGHNKEKTCQDRTKHSNDNVWQQQHFKNCPKGDWR
eukprot:2554562-Amphidinium_carterae.1